MEGDNRMAVRNKTLGDPRKAASESDSERFAGKFETSGKWTVIDLFSGGGGMSCGFARRDPFKLIAAVDLEVSKPSQKLGSLDCNRTYAANYGFPPFNRNIGDLSATELFDLVNSRLDKKLRKGDLTVLICCPPCTDFSRAKPENHLVDTEKNSLVVKCVEFVEAFMPEFIVMENARELINGNNGHHYQEFVKRVQQLGYSINGQVVMLTKYGLPQIRERAIVVASRIGEAKSLDDLWQGWKVRAGATTVRHAIGHLNAVPIEAGIPNEKDPMHQAPGIGDDLKERMDAIPKDGGSWYDLADRPDLHHLLIPSMRRRIEIRDFGSHPDVYGRLWWDRPAVTIKRECTHIGNGRYSHPEQSRLLTVREMALLNGFPSDYLFTSSSLANQYRHIGDAVPPLISFQLSAIVHWIKTGRRPSPQDWILSGTSLKLSDVVEDETQAIQQLSLALASAI